MLPSLLAEELQKRLISYLATTFELADDDARKSLERFLSDPETSIFSGPFLRARLPFRPASEGWQSHLAFVPDGFQPYRHQAAAFARLTSKDHQPEPTIVTTGTGSGKTESFLFPVLDHCRRQCAAGKPGIKALILYPMNALANDQATRIARLVAQHPEQYGEITAGLFTGDSGQHRFMGPDHIIENRGALRANPPDILLTNYKMLDRLLLRQDDIGLWDGAAENLQYLVLDEFHTYDGAQGTDVALLLRRLGMALGISRDGQPLGSVAPVATSATLGDGTRADELLRFAETVFGCPFTESALVREDRLTTTEWIGTVSDADAVPVGRIPLLSEIDELIPDDREVEYEQLVQAAITAFFELGEGAELGPTELSAALKHHPLTAEVVAAAAEPTTFDHALRSLGAVAPTWVSALDGGEADSARRALSTFVALLSHARTGNGDQALLQVETQLWVREVTHLIRSVDNVPTFLWYDDNPGAEMDRFLAAVFCRHCGRGGWGAALAGAAGNQLDDRVKKAWKLSVAKSDRFRAFLHAAGEADATPEKVAWLDPVTLEVLWKQPDHHEECVPVVTTEPSDLKAAADGKCPSCEKTDGIRFLGSRVSTLTSVALSHLFGHAGIPEQEKKTLVFTDSVQDAAHRAGFIESRAYAFNLRSALHRAVRANGVRLDQIAGNLIGDVAGPGNRAARYALLPPNTTDLQGFKSFWAEKRVRNTARVEARMDFAAHLEFGLNSRTGRTMELTGTISVLVDTDNEKRFKTRVSQVVAEHRPADLELETGFAAQELAWARGILERIRTQGAIGHKFLDRYIHADGNRWPIWGGRDRRTGMPAFHKNRPAPAFPTDAARSEQFDSIVAPRTWFTWWTHRCLGVPEVDAPRLVHALFRMLADESILQQRTTKNGATVYLIPPDRIWLDRTDLADLAAGRSMLRCHVCQTRTPVHPDIASQLADAPCLRKGCGGRLHPHAETDNYYRTFYNSERVRRIVSREHTALLSRDQRTEVEREFKESTEPNAPNVLVCTPTLELGIDIGDLGAVGLTSLPRATAGYLQRVGRAGRRSGNAFVVAILPARPTELRHFGEPLDMIAGEVVPPACYLDAEEILRRQYLASLIDRSAARSRTKWAQPKTVPTLLKDGLAQGRWLRRLLDDARANAETYVTEFLETLGKRVTDGTAAALRDWAGAASSGEVPGIERTVQTGVMRWARELNELNSRIADLDAVAEELKAKRDLLEGEARTDFQRVTGERKAARRLRRDVYEGNDWVGALESLGLLPNYTLLDDRTRLDVSLWWIDEETTKPEIEECQYERGSRTALSELAPGATFYASRRAVRIDAVDVGSEHNSLIQRWRFCPACGWSDPDDAPQACPRCHSEHAADSGQRLDVVAFRRVSAFAALDESRFGDEDEERKRTAFEIATSADVAPEDIRDAWQLRAYPFGAEFCRKIRIRWFNLGLLDRGGAGMRIAGEEYSAPRFQVCTGCGVVPAAQGKDQNEVRHRGWCPQRSEPDPAKWANVALMHELQTEALRVLVPPIVFADDAQLVSFTAALKLGLRGVLGGRPDHLDAFCCVESGSQGRRQMVVLHDQVPGGTGYLTRFTDPENLLKLLEKAKETLENCGCVNTTHFACHRCLLSVGHVDDVELLSRDRALGIINDVLEHWDPVEGTGVHQISTTIDETHIERRFRAQLYRWAQQHKLRPQLSAGTYGDSLRFAVDERDGHRNWIVEPQVNIDNVVKPDFVISPVDFSTPRIAVFCDSVRFHASAEHNVTTADARKRAILRERGYLVWAVTHQDMEEFERVLAGAKPNPLPFLTAGQRNQVVASANRTSGLGSMAARKVVGDAMTLLTAYLVNPDRDHWRNVAQAVAGGLVASCGKAGMTAADKADLPRIVVEHGRGAPIPPPSGPQPVALTETANDAGVVVLPVAKTKDLAVLLVLNDAADKVGSPAHAAAWRDWLATGNVLQFLDRELPRFAAATTSKQLEPDEIPGAAAAEPRFNADWRLVIDVAETELRELLVALATRDVAPPLPGDESPDGAWQIDLSWPEEKVAVLVEESADRIAQLREHGWRVVPADAEKIIEELQQVSGGAR
ncbi:DEAD/DEAH box helicase [Saccharopolyspora hattusasensis]|uniref:DEAD/DEAH box helicase n=1 Tax=Saccharopolyspora hattusasensis TaxID=1128679 RepID=UPI003D965A3E